VEDGDARIASLEARVQALEDIISIYQTMSFYGPALDSGLPATAAGLWTEDGDFVIDGRSWKGRQAIGDMLDGDLSRALRDQGGCHFISVPYVRRSGDTAVVTCFQQHIVKKDDAHVPWRVVAVRLELVREEGTWWIVHRTNYALDGSPQARELLRRAMQDIDDPGRV
jgi:uncharacterized protein (TIGR02246 family)